MKRYIKLYFSYMKRSLISKMEYKKDTFIAMMGFLIENAAAIASIYFIIRAIPSLEGWNIYQIGFLYGFTMLPRGIDHLLTDELWLIAYRKVKSGELDQYFLRPLRVLFQVLAETFQADAFGELIVGTVMLIFCGIQTNVVFTFPLVMLFIVASIFGAMIITSLKIAISSLAFVFKSCGPTLQIIYNFLDYVKYPIKIFPLVIQSILVFLIPFGLFISLPVESLYFGTYNPYLLMGLIIVVAIIMLTISIIIWNALERRYESTGS